MLVFVNTQKQTKVQNFVTHKNYYRKVMKQLYHGIKKRINVLSLNQKTVFHLPVFKTSKNNINLINFILKNDSISVVND